MSSTETHGHLTQGQDVGIHGMLLFGADKLYLSHLPMFQAPHEYQVIFEASLTKDGSDPRAAYLEDRKTMHKPLYTLVPERFAMSNLISEDEGSALRSFTGTIFRGHFERGGTPLAEDVVVGVERMLFAAKFDRDAERGPLTYLCFGKPGELFAAHLITKRPDFDQIVEVTLVDPQFSEPAFVESTFSRVALAQVPDRENTLAHRPAAHERFFGDFFQSIGPRGQHGFGTELEVEAELYLESGDLR